MNRPARPPAEPGAPLPDLASLSGADKDALIRRLWTEVARTNGGAARLDAVRAALDGTRTAGRSVSAGELLDELRHAATMGRARAPSEVRFRLGTGLGMWWAKPVLALALLAAAAFLADFGIGWYQQRTLEARRVAGLKLESAAFNRLYVELLRATLGQDQISYRATMTMQNIGAELPMYVMLTPVRVFVQSGLSWQEVPSQSVDGKGWGVVPLTGGHDYEVEFAADVEDWAELIPGYMHVRIDSDMLISLSSEPTDDIIERRNRFYIYLKPHGADDEEIRRRSNLKGEPPAFIPMPPH